MSDVIGMSGEAIIRTARLIDAPAFKDAMAVSGATLGIITSEFVYETAIRHSATSIDVSGYRLVQVNVKESSIHGWMQLIDLPLPTLPNAAQVSGDPQLTEAPNRSEDSGPNGVGFGAAEAPGGNSGPGLTKDGERARSAAGQYEVLTYSRLGQVLVVLLDAPPAATAENLERPPIEGTIEVNAYLDTEDAAQASLVSRALDALGRLIGYDGPHGETIDRGSIFRRAKAKLQPGIDADEAMKLRIKLEHAVELVAIGERQAKVDQAEAAAFSTALASIADIPSACLIVGSLLIVKFIDSQGPIVLVRPLSALEMRTLERCPGIQRDPSTALETLATAIAALEGADEGSS
jgi:hypothetical protein